MADSLERIIFFDLETSSLHRAGQILNFCFVCVDKNWNELDRIKGTVKLSRIELPDPMAIIATGIDVVDLQKNGTYTEYEAIRLIHQFLKKWENPSTGLSGYNTEDFDIPYLRTCMLRNGFYPYLKIKSCDLMILTLKALGNNDELRSRYKQYLSELKQEANPRFSIKLENIAGFFSLLDRPQSHESEDDVEVTIALAKKLELELNESIFTFEPYQLYKQQIQNGAAIAVETVSRSFDNPIKKEFFVFLRSEGNSSYWTSLEEFKKWDSQKTENLPIKRFKHCEALRKPCNLEIFDEHKNLALLALDKLKGFSVDQLYPPKDVYIEQWIYRLTPREIIDFCNFIHSNSENSLSSSTNKKDLATLSKRFLLACCNDQQIASEHQETFIKYCHYRYGGKMVLYTENDREKPKDRPTTHLTYAQLTDEIELARKSIKEDELFKTKHHALDSLSNYYKNSQIAAIFN